MNVLFMDYRYFRKDAWIYIVDVLKVKKVFFWGYIDEIPFSYLENVKVFVKNGVDDFNTKITYDIANSVKRPINTPDGDFFGYDDFDLYENSNYSTPQENILNTEDPNILILGKVRQNVSAYWVRSYFQDIIYSSIPPRDYGLDIVFHILNILKKQLKSDKYEKRICFRFIDIIANCDYSTTGKKWVCRATLMPFLFKLLQKKYHEIFQNVKDPNDNDHDIISNLFKDEYFCERDKLKQRCLEAEEEEKERWAYEASMNAGRSWQEEIDEINRQFWNECGEAINEM